MQNVMFRLAAQPGRIRWAGRPLGADNDEVFGQWLGLTPESRAALAARGVL